MKIILLRHGETVWNKERRLQGCRDIPLAEDGMKQIRQAGKYLAESDITVDLVLTSPLQRARRSAEIIADEIHYPTSQIRTAPLFTERSFGECEGLVYEEAQKRYPDGNYPGMETLDQLYDRAEAAIRDCCLCYPDKTILVAAHGAIIKAVLVVLTGGKIDYFTPDVWIENGSFCILEKNGESFQISLHQPQSHYMSRYL